jgi:DNA-binding response OmpR family regulator
LRRAEQLRNVLIVEDRASIRNVLDLLLTGLGCECDLACYNLRALGTIEKGSFDAMLLDLRYTEIPAAEMGPPIKVLRPNLLGRVLIITGEVSDPRFIMILKKNCWTYAPPHRVIRELWGRIRSRLRISQPTADSVS